MRGVASVEIGRRDTAVTTGSGEGAGDGFPMVRIMACRMAHDVSLASQLAPTASAAPGIASRFGAPVYGKL